MVGGGRAHSLLLSAFCSTDLARQHLSSAAAGGGPHDGNSASAAGQPFVLSPPYFPAAAVCPPPASSLPSTTSSPSLSSSSTQPPESSGWFSGGATSNPLKLTSASLRSSSLARQYKHNSLNNRTSQSGLRPPPLSSATAGPEATTEGGDQLASQSEADDSKDQDIEVIITSPDGNSDIYTDL